MYGKHYAAMYTGSMVGSGAHVFAVWGYVIAHVRMSDSSIELNPRILGTILGESPERVEDAIEVLCSPDKHSRSQENDGRRMVKEAPFLYRVVNAVKYNCLKDEDARREYMRVYMKQRRAEKSGKVNSKQSLTSVNPCNELSTHGEAYATANAEATAVDCVSQSSKSSELNSKSKTICENFQKTENVSLVLFENDVPAVPKLPKAKTVKKAKEPPKQLNGYNPVTLWIDGAKFGMKINNVSVTKSEITWLTELGNMYSKGEFLGMMRAYSQHCLEKGIGWRLYYDFYLNRHEWRRRGGAGTPAEIDPDDIDENLIKPLG